ncbi:hypothetical protein ACERII_13335 [Evansella sp. AB-rgal1]|uniref:hypothetical protein n=1 Tax=Evansella sp. AB-rgal1 TaxID=3242696 RepID=UPI00359DC3B6
MAVSMLGMIPLLIIVLLIFIIGGAKAQSSEGGEFMINKIYVYLVLFATLMMTIGGSVAAFMAVADIIAPTSYHESFEEYKRWGHAKENGSEEVNLSEEEMKASYDAMVSSEKERQIEIAKNNLVKSFGWIVIPLPIFIYFQRRLNRID